MVAPEPSVMEDVAYKPRLLAVIGRSMSIALPLSCAGVGAVVAAATVGVAICKPADRSIRPVIGVVPPTAPARPNPGVPEPAAIVTVPEGACSRLPGMLSPGPF